ncbi:hypothetical protein Sjap_004313 [Stephania japonica]|uniref:Uncharacterized protein n=1 Tax=Stephania japonica TaxID=461633 RepID=A0AAP0K315_9MAGN
MLRWQSFVCKEINNVSWQSVSRGLLYCGTQRRVEGGMKTPKTLTSGDTVRGTVNAWFTGLILGASIRRARHSAGQGEDRRLPPSSERVVARTRRIRRATPVAGKEKIDDYLRAPSARAEEAELVFDATDEQIRSEHSV